MIITIKKNAEEQSTKKLQNYLYKNGYLIDMIHGNNIQIMCVIGDTSSLDTETLKGFECVEDITKLSEPYREVSKKFHPEDTVINVGDVKIGQNEKIVFIAGPCSVEGEEIALSIAEKAKKYGASIFRGGSYKARTSPYSFQGLKKAALDDLKKVKDTYNLPVVSEIVSINQIKDFVEKVDIIQVGARNMQNFELLKALGKINKPILLKRGLSATLDELLLAAEYILIGGNKNVILCERGIRTFESATRNTLDLSAVPYLKNKTHLPVIVDPSHATGNRDLVEPMTLAAIACGADGIMVEVHDNPESAWSDSKQTIDLESFKSLVEKSRLVAKSIGREIN